MCGITGIVAFNSEGEKHFQGLENAVATLSKRGPDNQGVFRKNRIGLGHSRLSIIDTSSAGSQPFTDITGRYTIVYNGEFYNYKEHRKMLSEKGISFSSESDTEVLLNLYIHEGPAFLEKINGIFAFAIYDKKEDSLFIARDRMGIKPLLVYRDDDKLIFGSEMKALMAFKIQKDLDRVSLFTYLQLNYIPAPDTIFNNVKKLVPGTYLIVNKNKVSTHQYYSIPHSWDQGKPMNLSNYEKAKSTLHDLLDNSIKSRLVSDVPLGTFLSGGIDSSIITSVAAK
jgi:asparagine synthase (glutamine-hydrolysing)